MHNNNIVAVVQREKILFSPWRNVAMNYEYNIIVNTYLNNIIIIAESVK